MRLKITIATFSLVTLCLLITSGTSYAKLEDGLVSAWTFDDGSARDFQGDNHGEILGGVEAADGKFSKALSFDGTDGHIQIPHDASMDAIADGFTFAAWILQSAGTHGNSGVATKGPGTGWGLQYSFKITLDWWGVSSAGTEGYFGTNGALNKPGEWILACLTADGAEAIGYSAPDGGELDANPKVIAGPYLIEPDFPMEIGVARMADGTTDQYFNGIIDQVYFWDRALSAEEVEELANGATIEFVTSSVEPSGKLSTLWGTIRSQ